MIKYYQLKTRAINIILSIFGKNVFTYVIYSPQRTFSNFFEQFLERNVFINFEKGKKNINYYKHNPGPILDNKIKNKFIVFILYKEFDIWYESLKKNPMDFFGVVNEKFNKNIRSIKEKKKLKRYHKDFYLYWINKKKKIKNLEFINFRDVLEKKDLTNFVKYLKDKYKVKIYPNFTFPKSVRFSSKFNKKKYSLSKKSRTNLDLIINDLCNYKK